MKRGVAASGSHCGAQDWYVFGNALKELRQYNEAVSCYDHALAKSPNFREALNNKGICMQALGDENAAQGLYNRSSKLGNSIAGENAANLRDAQNQRAQQTSPGYHSFTVYNDFLRQKQYAAEH